MHREVRAAIYTHFREEASAPTVGTIATILGISHQAVGEALDALADSHAIVLRPDSQEIWMAHPFSGVPTDYTATCGDRTWFANCAWDAIAILSLLGNGTVTARDPLTAELNQWSVADKTVTPDGVVHFLVPARQFWDDIGFT